MRKLLQVIDMFNALIVVMVTQMNTQLQMGILTRHQVVYLKYIQLFVCQSLSNKTVFKINRGAGHQWLMILILATWEAEIWRIAVQGQPRQLICKTPSPKNNQSKIDCRCGSSDRMPALKA
jgi:hypothetical protein